MQHQYRKSHVVNGLGRSDAPFNTKKRAMKASTSRSSIKGVSASRPGEDAMLFGKMIGVGVSLEDVLRNGVARLIRSSRPLAPNPGQTVPAASQGPNH